MARFSSPAVRRGFFALAIFLTALTRVSLAGAEPRASVIDIEWDTSTGYDRCAGVVVGRTGNAIVALTAAHCTLSGFARVRFFDGSIAAGGGVRLVWTSRTSDLAEIAVAASARERRDTPPVSAAGPPPIGEDLAIIGHPVSALRGPNAGRWTSFGARMAQITRNTSGAPQIEAYCPLCGPGNSGSGVFDHAGRLIGIVYGVTPISGMADQPDGLYADIVPAR